jgi:hypothetical protein
MADCAPDECLGFGGRRVGLRLHQLLDDPTEAFPRPATSTV